MSVSFRLRRQFVDLVDDLRRHLDLSTADAPDGEDQALTLSVRHHGVAMTLFHDGTPPLDHYGIECHLDSMPSADRETARGLLALNFHCLREGLGTVAISEEHDAILLIRLAPLGNATAKELLDQLDTMAEVHRWWHEASPAETEPSEENMHVRA